ncbi:MAG: DUF2889 domain-containing protein [Rhodospirillaceae bacterium]
MAKLPDSPQAETGACARQAVHARTVICRGFRRDDGLWDIEGHLLDVKHYSFHTVHRGDIEPGDPIHQMRMRVTVTDAFEVVDIEATTFKSPFDYCGEITGDYRHLIGLTMGAGWTRAIKERLGGVKGCTHHTELLGPIATTAFQTIYPILMREQVERAAAKPGSASDPISSERPALLDVCHVFDTTGPFVREHWPDHYTGPVED